MFFFCLKLKSSSGIAPKHTTLRSFSARKNLLPLLFLFVCFYFISWCWFYLRFCVFKIFSQKKLVWNCPDNLILLYYWRVPLSTRLSRIYLYTFILICYHLWESLLFMEIFLNSSCLSSSVRIYFFKSLWK